MLCIYKLFFSLVLFSESVQFAINSCTWWPNQFDQEARMWVKPFYLGGFDFVNDGVLSQKLDVEVSMKVQEEVLISDLTWGSVCCASWWRPAASLCHFALLAMEWRWKSPLYCWVLWREVYFDGCYLFVCWACNTHNQFPMSQWLWWSQTNIFSNFHRMNFTEF